MPLFSPRNRRPEPPRQPDIYILHSSNPHGGIIRFFFLETLTHDIVRTRLQTVRDIPGILPGEGMRPYEHYIAVQWSTYVLPEDHMDESRQETEGRIEQQVLDQLKLAFGWDDPLVEELSTKDEVEEVSKQRDVSWQLGLQN